VISATPVAQTGTPGAQDDAHPAGKVATVTAARLVLLERRDLGAASPGSMLQLLGLAYC